MPSLSIRNVETETVSRLKRRAARHGRSAEAEVREILREALSSEAGWNFEELAERFKALTAHRKHTPSEVLVREGRAER